MLHNLQMQKQPLMHSLAVGLDLSSWMMCTAEEMRQTLMIVLTMVLVSTTVFIVKMQEWSVRQVSCVLYVCWSGFSTYINSFLYKNLQNSFTVFWTKTSACRDRTLKTNQPNRVGMIPQYFHTILQLCLVFVSYVHRRIVEGIGVGSAGCGVHVDVHGEWVMLWEAAM